jgi:hypothetical protein
VLIITSVDHGAVKKKSFEIIEILENTDYPKISLYNTKTMNAKRIAMPACCIRI